MFSITSKNGPDNPDADNYNFVNFIKTQLGWPVINVEVADRQINLIIDKAIKDFWRYNYGEGSFLDYAVFTTSAGVDTYDLSGYNILDVVQINILDNFDGVNTLFTPTHILLQELGNNPVFQAGTWSDSSVGYAGPRPGAGPSMGGGVPEYGLQLTNWTIATQYLELVKDMFGKQYATNWLPWREQLKIIPTPVERATGLLVLYRKENELPLYNCDLVQNLAVARAKIQWGEHIAKYSVTMPGGGTAQGERLIQEGKEEEEVAMLEIKGQSNPIDFFVG
jgi:hypothetical protein